MKKRNIIFVVFCLFIFSLVSMMSGQTQDQMRKEAESQLNSMSPDQIDNAIKQYGMTRAEADARAQELGINLESYLKGLGQSNVAPSTPSSVVVVNPSAPSVSNDSKEVAIERAAEAVALEEQKKESEALAQKKEPGEADLFGQSLFKTDATNFEPSPSISDKDYILGAGDVLKISLWGDAEFTSEFTVDKDGRIIIPSVGPVFVSGYSLDNAKKRIQVTMSKSYSGLVTVPPRIFMDLSISKLRPIRVFIMGEVMSPGGYFVSNFGSVFNSLFAAGGPKVSGSMRNVMLIRNNKTIANVDLYDYLLGSNKTNDIRVNDNDIIFVPLRGKTVKIVGDLLRPYRFEMLPNENLKKLLEFSGGFRNNIFSDRVLVDRILPFDERKRGEPERKVIDVDFKPIVTGKKDFPLQDGDIVSVFSILNIKENYVKIIGDVRRPGTYQIENIKDIKQLIESAEGVMPTTYLDRAELIRTYRNEKLESFTINLGLALQGDAVHNLQLMPMDSIRVYSIYEINTKKSITLTGHLKRTGTFSFADGLTINKILLEFGGYEDSLYKANTFLEKGYIYRLNEDLITRKVITFNVLDCLDPKLGSLPIFPGDQIRIFAKSEMEYIGGEVSIAGRVKRDGTFPIYSNLTLFEMIYQNVGLADSVFRESIFLDRADLIRYYPNKKDTYIKPFNLWNLYTKLDGDTLLLPGDRVIVYSRSVVETDDDFVEIFGSVKNPGRYKRSVNMNLIDLIMQAGGYTENAWTLKGEVARVGKDIQEEDSLIFINFPSLPDFFDTTRSKIEILKSTPQYRLQHRDQVFIRPDPNYTFQRIVTVEGEVNFPGKYSLVKRGEYLSNVILRAGGLTKDGYARGGKVMRGERRILFNMENALDDEEGDEDIILREGDVISIPYKPNTVNIFGEVQNPGLYGYHGGQSLEDYLEEAGDITDSADFVLITYPEGHSHKTNLNWLFGDNPYIPDGSSIFVTKKKPEPIVASNESSDVDLNQALRDSITFIASILTLIVLAKQLN